MLRMLNTLLLLAALVGTTFGGLIVQPTNGNSSVVPGAIVPFDLIIANETSVATGGTLDWTYQAIGPFLFATEPGGSELLGSNGVTYAFGPSVPPGQPTDLQSSTVAVPAGWSVNNALFTSTGALQYQADLGTPSETTVSGDQFLFGRVWVSIPAGFTGSFDFTLGRDSLGDDLQLTNSLGDNATANPPGPDPIPDWIYDANPPVGYAPPGTPGGNPSTPASTYTFTISAVPEPSGFLFMSLIGVVVGGVRFYRRKLG